MFPAAPAAPFARNVACRGSLVKYFSVFKIYYVLLSFLKPRLHINDFLNDSPRFIPISHGQKNRDGSGLIVAKSGNIQRLYDSSKNVHDISTVSLRYRYESMTIHDGNATVIED